MTDNTPTPGSQGPLAKRFQEPIPPPVPHPALLPGIGVEQTGMRFPTNWVVLIITATATIAVIVWAFVAPDNLAEVGALTDWYVEATTDAIPKIEAGDTEVQDD